MLRHGKIYPSDEVWWTMQYSSTAPHTNCIIGEALVLHISYAVTLKQMLDLGLLKDFENIVLMELGEALPKTLWNATDYI